MLDPQITTEVLNTVHTVNAVGLKEIWVSIEPNLARHLIEWAIDQGYHIQEAEWNHPESLYVGVDKPHRPLTVLAVQWQ